MDSMTPERTKPAAGQGRSGGDRTAPFRESELYPPLKAWLEQNGYEVHGEVLNCDLAARRGEELVLIELKRAVNLELLLQLVRRQEAEAAVYAAVPAPKAMNNRRWRELTRLLKRLEVGLILIFTDSPRRRVEVAFHPRPLELRRRKNLTRAILAEMSGRSVDRNCGGVNRRQLMTAYREKALAAAEALEDLGPSPPKAVRDQGIGPKAGDILRDNHYGWFERLGRGLYGLTEKGRQALAEYRDQTGNL